MSFLTTAGAFLVAIAVLIVVHEYGHYIVARICGVRVLKFSVGFGKTLWSRRIGPDQTEWAVSAIPFGGYVKMLDESEGTVNAAEAHRAFNRQSVARRFAIVAAGPVLRTDELLDDERLRQLGAVIATDHPVVGVRRQLGLPWRMDSAVADYRRAPLLGEHTHEVLTNLLGVDEAEYARLSADGVLN